MWNKLGGDETERIFNDFQNNYETIATNLYIKGNEIIIPKNVKPIDTTSSRGIGSPQGTNLKSNHSLSVIIEASG